MKTTYTREQAAQVLKDLNEFYGRSTPFYGQDEDFLNHKFPSLEVGKWYMHLDNLLYYVREIIDNKCFGYGFWDGEWFNDCNNIRDNNAGMQDTRPATDKEVEEALIAEAKRRGYRGGVFVNSFVHNLILRIDCSETGIQYVADHNKLHFGKDESRYVVVYQNGKWAEIINDPTKDKIAKLEATINKAQQELKELKGLVD